MIRAQLLRMSMRFALMLLCGSACACGATDQTDSDLDDAGGSVGGNAITDGGDGDGDGDRFGGQGGDGSGGATSGVGGEVIVGGSAVGGSGIGGSGIGGASSGGTGAGGSNASGGAVGVGGQPEVTEEVLWSWSYTGDSLAAIGDSYVAARLLLDGQDDCPVFAGNFEPQEAEVVIITPDSGDRTCLANNPDFWARFGPRDWDTPEPVEDFDPADPNLRWRFTLLEFTADPWPFNSTSDMWISFSWELIRI